MNFKSLLFVLIVTFHLSCNQSKSTKSSQSIDKSQITCSDNSCQGTYTGPEFINSSDIAHQFSNKMSKVVGDKLKELFDNKNYSKVDFSNVLMTTKGMGSGTVEYSLEIPFVIVDSRCEAYTSFDHVGGWNHKPELENRKSQLQGLLLKGGG